MKFDTVVAVARGDVREGGRLLRFIRRFGSNRMGMTGLFLTSGFVLSALVGLVLVSQQDVTGIEGANRLAAPSLAHPMGTDRYGRDILSRVIVGARLSLLVSVCGVVISTGLGVPLGLIAGYFQGKVDEFIMRIIDVLFAFPPVLLGLVIVAVSGTGLTNVIAAIGLAFTPIMARMVRGSALALRQEEFVLAAIAYGESSVGIMYRDMLANLLPVVIIQGTMIFASSIIVEAGLSYLGLSAQAPTPTWGVMISEGQGIFVAAPWVAFFPGLAIFLTVFGLTLLGVGLRDALDPNADANVGGLR